MTPESALDIFRDGLVTAIMIASPMLIVGLLIGLAISVFQAVTQINEMTLTFIPKMIGVVAALIIALPWIIRLMLTFTSTLYGNLSAYI